MVWYQMFEYAIGHWLQKATEHMIGCVLCSPGCFSLFRGKALMDDNVMRRFSFKNSKKNRESCKKKKKTGNVYLLWASEECLELMFVFLIDFNIWKESGRDIKSFS